MRSTKYRNQCYEVYGFDVMIDHKLRPWLLEVNVCPSLSSSSPYDKQVKTLLLCDTLHLVGYKIFDRKKIEEDKKKESKHRLLGFESRPRPKNENESILEISPQQSTSKTESPKKPKKEPSEPLSPDKYKVVKDKIIVPSFLEGFN